MYRKRIADQILEFKLNCMGAVLIQGPKWCGKTTTGEQVSKSILRLDDEVAENGDISLAYIDIYALLKGNTPRLIDEWQVEPRIFDAVRREVDERQQCGQFILTGSSVPHDDSKIIHSGAGRFAWLKMGTMTLFESGESSGEVSLKGLFDKPEEISGNSSMDLENLAFIICRGGWPQSIGRQDNVALSLVSEYYEAVVNSDINRADGIKKNSDRVRRVMRSLSRNQGSKSSLVLIKNDVIANETTNISEDTIAQYISALKDIFTIEDVSAWNPNIRSKTAIRAENTRYFTDPSIAIAAMGIGPDELRADLNTMGLIFETLCMRDLRIYSDAIGGSLQYYRDRYGLECDAIIHLKNGNYALVEIKLGGCRLIEEGADNLNKLESLILKNKMKGPSFKMILVGIAKRAYKRSDGVYVVPVSCLKP